MLWEIHSWASTFLMSKNSILWEIHIWDPYLGFKSYIVGNPYLFRASWMSWDGSEVVELTTNNTAPLAPESL